MHVMLAGIGETLEDEDDGEVMGVVVNVRKGFYRIGLWTKSTGKPFPGGGDGNTAGGKGRSTQQGQEVLLKIGKRFKDVLTIKDTDVVEFSGHVDAAHSGSTRAKAKLTI
jgi:translation initiation factor 4E